MVNTVQLKGSSIKRSKHCVCFTCNMASSHAILFVVHNLQIYSWDVKSGDYLAI